jgi:hypothetical protein
MLIYLPILQVFISVFFLRCHCFCQRTRMSTLNWTVRNIERYPDALVRVADARGTVVLNRTGYRNDWDARSRQGDVLPAGTYYYIITFGDAGRRYKGAITVLRGN